MKPTLFRFLFFFFLLVAEVSFVSPLVAPFSIPVLLSSLVSLSLVRGFSFALPWALVTGILFDLTFSSQLGVSSLEYMGAVLLFGFASKRIALGQGRWKLIFFSIAVWILSIVFRMFEALLPFRSFQESIFFFESLSAGAWGLFAGSGIVSLLVFVLVFLLVRSFERYLSLFENMPLERASSL